MPTPLRALIIEDVPVDALLIVRDLRRGGFDVTFERVDSPEALQASIAAHDWDIIISDYTLPSFDAPTALKLIKACNYDLPFIVVSGNTDDELAVQMIRDGAHDFIFKGEFVRLVQAVERALYDAQLARERAKIRAQLDAILDCAPAIILAVDRDGKIQFINRVLPNFKKEQVVGSDWLHYVHPDNRELMANRLARVLETGIPQTYEVSTPAPDSDTGKLWFSSHMGAMRSGDHVTGAVIISQDVTEIKRKQAEFAASQRLAAVGTLAAGVAHEINTPVQFVNDSVHFLRDATQDVFGLLERLKDVHRLISSGAESVELDAAIGEASRALEEADLAYIHEHVPKAFDRCIDGLERVATIVRSMKEFAHPAQQDMAPVDLNRAIENTLTIARNEYKYVADLEAEFDNLPPVVCYINDLNQVLLNLIVNAAHAIGEVVAGTDRKGTLRVRTQLDGHDVVISVSDTGGGIPEAYRSRIFDLFFTTKDIGKGTGQGLALAWSVITEKHGGKLTFETTLGVGTTFYIRLPIAGRPSTKPEREVEDEAHSVRR